MTNTDLTESKNANGLTLEMINSFYTGGGHSIHNTIEYAQGFRMEYPSAPKKPFLKNGANSVEVMQYASDLKQYEDVQESYKIAKNGYYEVDSEISKIIEEFIKEESGLNTIPEQYRAKVYNRAWEEGHSYGYGEVYIHLINLVDIFD